jgi:hypothetical protein
LTGPPPRQETRGPVRFDYARASATTGSGCAAPSFEPPRGAGVQRMDNLRHRWFKMARAAVRPTGRRATRGTPMKTTHASSMIACPLGVMDRPWRRLELANGLSCRPRQRRERPESHRPRLTQRVDLDCAPRILRGSCAESIPLVIVEGGWESFLP